MTNADLITEARQDHNRACAISQRLADALEASEAQVARLKAVIAGAGTPEEMNITSAMVARIDSENVPYPADLLAAVDQIVRFGQLREQDRATLRRYGRIEEARS